MEDVTSSFIVALTTPEAADAQQVGPKAANLARLAQAGLPTPGGFCVNAEAYRAQLRHSGLEAAARGTFSTEEAPQARRYALQMKLGLMEQEDATLDGYVTRKALDGLYFVIAEQERAMRKDPLGAATGMAQKVFGMLRE